MLCAAQSWLSRTLRRAHRGPLRKAGRTLLLAVAGFGTVTIIFGISRSFWLSMAMLYFLGSIELFGAALVAVGLFAAPAAFLLSGTMAFAFFIGHVLGDQNPTHTIIPLLNQGEVAVLYCFAFLLIAAKGSGIWSVDAARGK